MKIFKNGMFLLTMIVMLSVAIAITNYFFYVGPQLAAKERLKVEAAAIELEMKEMDKEIALIETQLRRQAVTNAFPVMLGVTFFVVVVGFGVFFYIKIDKRNESWARPVDGMFALQTHKKGGITWQVDPNKLTTSAIGVAESGEIAELPILENFGADRQLAQNKSVQQTRNVLAMASGESNVGRYVAPWKFLSGAWDRGVKLLPDNHKLDEDSIQPEVEIMSMQDAWNMSNEKEWIVGQSKLDGDIAKVSLKESVHFGIIGSTNCGKTSSTGLMLAAYAAKNQYHVICLDAKGGIDWAQWSDIFETQETNDAVFSGQLNAIIREYKERQQWLKDNKETSIYTCDSPYKPLFIILEEVGALFDNLQRKNRRLYDHTVSTLTTIMRVSRAAGIHFCLIDQTLDRWPSGIANIIKLYFAYKLSAGNGATIGIYQLNKLANVGEYCLSTNDQNRYKSWYMKDEMKNLDIPKRTMNLLPPLPAITDSTSGIQEINESRFIKPEQPESVEPTLTEQQILDAFKQGGNITKATQILFGQGKKGKHYNEKILPVLVKHGVVKQ